MLDISILAKEDAPLLSEIQSKTFKQAYSDVHSTADIDQYCASNFSIAKALALLDSGQHLCKSIARHGEVVGFYTVNFQDSPVRLSGASAELKQIYVLANNYGLGIGKRLLDDVLMETKERRYQWLWLAVSDLNVRARSFYRKLGFEEVGTGPIFEVGNDRLSSSILAREF